MQQLAITRKPEPTMTSRELLDLINQARDTAGERPVRLNDLNDRIVDELAGEHYESFVVQNSNKTTSVNYLLSRDQCLLVAMRESKHVRRQVRDQLRAVEAYAANDSTHQLPGNYVEALECLLAAERQKQTAVQEVTRLRTVCDTMTRQLQDGLTVPEFCKQLNGVNTREVQNWLCRKGYLRHLNGGHAANARYRDTWFAQKMKEVPDRPPRYYVALTEKGARNLYALYLKGDLPMKNTWDGIYTHDLFGGVQ